MDRKEFAEKQVKTAGTEHVVIETTDYLDERYEIQAHSKRRASDTGHIIVAELKPKTLGTTLPTFYLRWDDPAQELDVDIYWQGLKDKYLWDVAGYSGHKTKLVNPDNRTFRAEIMIPDGKVYSGTIRVGLSTELQLHENVQLTDSVNVDTPVVFRERHPGKWTISRLWTGRIARMGYFGTMVVSGIALIPLNVVLLPTLFPNPPLWVLVFLYLISLPVYIVRFGLIARRAHDFGYSAWIYPLIFIPFVNVILGLFLVFTPGDSKANKYGEPPAHAKLFDEMFNL